MQWKKKIKSKFKKNLNGLLLPPNWSLRGLAFKNICFTLLSLLAPIRLGWMCILNRFFIRTSVMVALVHVYNLLSALNEQQTNFFMFFTLQFKIGKVWKLWDLPFTGLGWGTAPCPPLYTPLNSCTCNCCKKLYLQRYFWNFLLSLKCMKCPWTTEISIICRNSENVANHGFLKFFDNCNFW